MTNHVPIREPNRRGPRAALPAILLISVALAGVAYAQPPDERPGEIVRPATGAGRAVYAPLDQAWIPSRLQGRWAARPGRCVGQLYTDRMELGPQLAIVDGRTLAIHTVLAEAGAQAPAPGGGPPHANDLATMSDVLVAFDQSGRPEPRHIHFRLARAGDRLIVEEVGKPRRAYVRCF